MSILSPTAQGPKSSFSPPDPSLNPSFSEHGSPDSFGSPPLAPSPSPHLRPDPMASSVEGTSGSSSRDQEVKQSRTGRGQETFSCQRAEDTHSLSRSDGQRAKPRGRTVRASQAQHSAGPTNFPRAASHQNVTGRRAHTTSGNHLLNFHYDPISRSRPRAPPPPPRRQYKRRPYNRDLFLQANFKFVVLDTGDHSPDSMDPDKMLQWEDIICVRYSTPSPVQCPICLECPLCPQITSCGHVFCFPCILQYLLMGVENHKTECFKRCPLCFVMVSPKDLYTIYIENVKQYSVGDTIEFVLLTRQKDSFTPSQKNERDFGLPNLEDKVYDPFSKFTFTTDVDLSVRQAFSELDGWLARADSGLVDDLEKLPYVSAALGQLEQRKKYWNERRNYHYSRSSTKARNQMRSMSYADVSQVDHHVPSCGHRGTGSDDQNKSTSDSSLDKSDGESSLDKSGDDDRSMEDKEARLSSSYSGSNGLLVRQTDTGGLKDKGKSGDDTRSMEDKEAPLSSSYSGSNGLLVRQTDTGGLQDKGLYNFYQAVDGQHIILHTLNVKCLLHHCGSYGSLPPRVSGKILELETISQSEAMRKRYRYLSHFSLTTAFQICEIDMRESLPPDALAPFIGEIKKRKKERKQRALKERKEKTKAEVAAAAEFVPLVASCGQSSCNDSPSFSLDDFAVLGNSVPVQPSPPEIGERKSFSNVTRLGFAAGHDSPGLKNQESEVTNNAAGGRNAGTASFAKGVAREGSSDSGKEVVKKGKKPTRVLLSTTGGRRY